MDRFQIKLEPAEEGMFRVCNLNTGLWYTSLPGTAGVVSKCSESPEASFTLAQVTAAFKDTNIYEITRVELHAVRMGLTQLYRVYDPSSEKWCGMASINEPFIWVDSRHDGVSINQRTIAQAFPEQFFNVIWK